MKSSNDLYQLVKSLTQSEKRYIKLFSNISSKKEKNNYIRLFEIIESISEENYTEELLRNKLKKVKFNDTHLHVAKNYLYDQILKSLRSFYNGNSDESQLENYLKDARLCFKKSLFSQVEELLTKAEKCALESENFNYLMEIYNLQIQTFANSTIPSHIRNEYRKQINQKRILIINLLKNINDYAQLWQQLSSLTDKVASMRIRNVALFRQINKISESPLCINEELALSQTSKKIFFALNYTLHSCLLKDKAYEWGKKFLQHFEQHPFLIKKNFPDYFYTLNNLLNNFLLWEKYDDYIACFQKLKTLPERFSELLSIHLKSELVIQLLSHELNLCFKKNAFVEAESILNKNLETYLRIEGKTKKSKIKVATDYYIAYTYFSNGNYKKSLQWINLIINNPDNPTPPFIQCYLRILSLLIYYELEYFDLFEGGLRSTSHFLTKNENFNAFEEITLNALHKLSKYKDKQELENIYLCLIEDLTLLDSNQSFPLMHLNLIAWAKSKLYKISFEEAAQLKLVNSQLVDH